MARYTGPKSKIARKFGEPIYGADKSFERKKYPPGQHGRSKRSAKHSEYRIQLYEKQKARYTYGILERQFRNMFEKSSRKKGNTGQILLQICESRLDNVVYRLGLAKSRPAARQLVSHKHITVDGKLENFPSFILKPGSVIAIREKSKGHKAIQEALDLGLTSLVDWLSWNKENLTGTFHSIPQRDQIPERINEQLIVELYSK